MRIQLFHSKQKNMKAQTVTYNAATNSHTWWIVCLSLVGYKVYKKSKSITVAIKLDLYTPEFAPLFTITSKLTIREKKFS